MPLTQRSRRPAVGRKIAVAEAPVLRVSHSHFDLKRQSPESYVVRRSSGLFPDAVILVIGRWGDCPLSPASCPPRVEALLWLRKADIFTAGSVAQKSRFAGAATVAIGTVHPFVLKSPGNCRAGGQAKNTVAKRLGVGATLGANAHVTNGDAFEANPTQTSRIRVPLPPQRLQ